MLLKTIPVIPKVYSFKCSVEHIENWHRISNDNGCRKLLSLTWKSCSCRWMRYLHSSIKCTEKHLSFRLLVETRMDYVLILQLISWNKTLQTYWHQWFHYYKEYKRKQNPTTTTHYVLLQYRVFKLWIHKLGKHTRCKTLHTEWGSKILTITYSQLQEKH